MPQLARISEVSPDSQQSPLRVVGVSRYLPMDETGEIKLITNEQLVTSFQFEAKDGATRLDADWPERHLGVRSRAADLEWDGEVLSKKRREEGGLWPIDLSCLAIVKLLREHAIDGREVFYVLRYTANQEEIGNDKQKRHIRQIPGLENVKIKEECYGCSAFAKALDDANDIAGACPKDRPIVLIVCDASMSVYSASNELRSKWRRGINRFPMAMLFGDSGVAIAVTREPDPIARGRRQAVVHLNRYAVDTRVSIINSVVGGTANPVTSDNFSLPPFEMNAREIRALFAPVMGEQVKAVSGFSQARFGKSVDYWAFHQASAVALEELCEAFSITPSQTRIEAKFYGNASAAAAAGVFEHHYHAAPPGSHIGVVTMGEGDGGLCAGASLLELET